MEQATERDKTIRRKTSIVMPGALLQTAKFAALEEERSVGGLPSRLAEQHLKARKGARR